MTNEELVALIQAGERDRLPELWEQVERFVALQANRLLHAMGPDRAALAGVEFGDLYNSGYFALVDAVERYDPAQGMQFIGLFALRLKSAFAEAGGWRTSKRDPLNSAKSMDARLKEDDEGSGAFGDFIPDPRAAQALQDVEEQQYQEQLHAALERALGTLEDDEEAVIRARYYQGPRPRQQRPALLENCAAPRPEKSWSSLLNSAPRTICGWASRRSRTPGKAPWSVSFSNVSKCEKRGAWHDGAGAGTVALFEQGN